jgi:hypothetical protein
MIRQELVDTLAEAYRHRGSPYAEAVIANRHLDLLPEECSAAVSVVLAETHAQLAILTARLGLPTDTVSARLTALLELPDAELEELQQAGLLDDLGLS